jgi:hypothetical protein
MTIRSLHSILIGAVAGCTLLTAKRVVAQTAESPAAPTVPARWEFLVNSGTLVPTGAEHHAIKRANLTAAQLTYVVRPMFAVTSTFDWARSRDAAVADNPKLDVFTYDIGAEVRAPHSMTGEAATFRPFAGVGLGGRSYNYRKLDVDATHNVAAYGSVGGEIGVRRVRIRLEARDYVTTFKPLRGDGASRSGNDIVLMAGLRLVSR